MGRKKRPSRAKRIFWCVFRRFFLVLFTVIVVAVAGAAILLNLIFNGPSTSARTKLTMSMRESSGMKWFPQIFIGEEALAEIEKSTSVTLPEEISNSAQIKIDLSSSVEGAGDEWENHPEGIYIEEISGDTYNAYVMIIRDPSRVYQATSHLPFTESVPGTRITQAIEDEGAVAAINAGAFYDSGISGDPTVGSVPCGLVIAGGEVVFNAKHSDVPEKGFVGFNEDNVLVVAQSMTSTKAIELKIRDGCEFGPVLIMNGHINEEAYNDPSGLNPRTCMGQRADGAVILLVIDGRQVSSFGGTYADAIDIMVEYGAVNACNLDGGSSSVMLYRDPETGIAEVVNSYSLLQKEPRRMPTFFMVAPLKEESSPSKNSDINEA